MGNQMKGKAMSRKKEVRAAQPSENFDEQTVMDRIRAKVREEFEAQNKPHHDRELYEQYKRAIQSGESAQISGVIYQALSRGDLKADIALREHIATLIDAGRADELGTQLKYVAIQYLVHPQARPLLSWVRE